MSKSELQCSFCGKKKNQTSLLIAGIDAHICDMCIEQANGIILQESQTRSESISKKSNNELLKPQQIKLFLDDYIIGQDYTKKVISVSVYNHYKRLNQEVENDVEIETIMLKRCVFHGLRVWYVFVVFRWSCVSYYVFASFGK